MIKYRVDGKFVEEETFYAELKKSYDKVQQPFTYDKCLDLLKTNGCVRLDGKSTRYNYNYTYFYVADEQVFELEEIVAESEFDPLDGDAFYVAFAIYNKGFRKQ